MRIEFKGETCFLDFKHEFSNYNHPKKTIAILTGSDRITLIGMGTAFCHPGDQFCKAKGRKIALAKLLQDLFSTKNMVFGGDINLYRTNMRNKRKQIWDQYFSFLNKKD